MKKYTILAYSLLCGWLACSLAQAQNLPPFLNTHQRWVDSVFARLTPDERIAQLIMVAAYSNRNQAHEKEITDLIQQYKIGGLVFFQGGPVRQAHLTNRFQKLSKVPLFVAMDAEWGLGMRLDSTISFPYQMTLGAIHSDTLLYQMGVEVARQCKRLGVHINFAPVVDVNNNPNNPVINFRSFGEDKENVARKSIQYMRGMQDNQILTTAKHFPGHGDTDADSHYALPLIRKSRQQLDSLELYPFRKIIEAGAGGIMVAHLSIPSLDTTRNQASTLSKPIVSNLLKKDLGFQGLAFTDAMNMQGVAKYYAPGIADVKAILAGNDVLEFTADVPKAIAEIRNAIKTGKITQAEIDVRCKKVLAAKAWTGLNMYRPIAVPQLVKDLNTPQAKLLHRKLTEASLTLLRNNQTLVPLQKLDTLKIASISIGTSSISSFQKMLGKYTTVKHFVLSTKATTEEIATVRAALKAYNLVVVGIHVPSIRPGNSYGITDHMQKAVREVTATGKPTILCHFGNPYTLLKFDLTRANALILGYQDNTVSQELTAQAVFGAVVATGRLPVTVSPAFSLHNGLGMNSLHRLKYTQPEEVGVSSERLEQKVDSVAQLAISQHAAPGCQVLVAKEGKVIFHKTYGYHTYENLQATQENDLYDLASVTKITTSTLALMRLTGEGKFGLDKTLADYLPEYQKSNKKHLVFRDILTHQAGLTAWIPFWKEAVKKNGKWKWHTFKADSSRRFPVKVVDKLWLHRHYSHRIFKEIRHSPVSLEKKYVYSDLSYYLYPQIVKKLTGQDFETYLKDNFYRSLGVHTLTFRPLSYFPKDQIVPTEYDSLFRKTQLLGTVHDEGAAMLNGLSGHAGLFGTANDLAKLMQMYLQMGEYGSVRYIQSPILKEWSQYNDVAFSRRGIAFDKPDPKSPGLSAAASASPDSFGHSGFTGTFIWADPQNQLVYIFLANRVYPTRNNTKLLTLNIRTGMQQAIYEAIREVPRQ